MFEGKVYLIKRNTKIIHVGVKINGYTASACNIRWDIRDEVSVGDPSEVTCKRCKKIIEKADEDGYIVLGPTKRKVES